MFAGCMFTQGETETVMAHTVLVYSSVDGTKERMSHSFLSALSLTLVKPCWTPFGLVYIEWSSYCPVSTLSQC